MSEGRNVRERGKKNRQNKKKNQEKKYDQYGDLWNNVMSFLNCIF